MENLVSDLATPQRARRLARGASVAALACCALTYAIGFLRGRAGEIASLLAFVGFTASYFILRAAVQQAADLPEAQLDEREVAVRDRAYLLAYQGVGAVAALSVVLAIADEAIDNLTVYWVGPWSAVLLLALALPSVVVAHLQPEADADSRAG